MGNNGTGSSDAVSGVGQTASIGKATSVSSGAAKVFREFKWGLLTLFLLMVVVVGLVYDGGTKRKADAGAKKPAVQPLSPEVAIDGTMVGVPPGAPGGGDVAGLTEPLTGPVTGGDPLLQPAQPGGHALGDAGVPPTIPAGTIPAGLPAITPPAAPVGAGQNGGAPVVSGWHGAHGGNQPVPGVTPPFQPIVQPQPNPPAAQGKIYKVASGDTLSGIAKKHDLGKNGLAALLKANPKLAADPRKLRIGQDVMIPDVAPTAATANTSSGAVVPGVTTGSTGGTGNTAVTTAGATPAGTPAPVMESYTVKPGDTLERIARNVLKDGRRWREIQDWNRSTLSDASLLRVGQVLKIKHGVTAGDAPAAPATPATAPTSTPKKAKKTAELEIEVDQPGEAVVLVPASKPVKRPVAPAADEPQAEGQPEVLFLGGRGL